MSSRDPWPPSPDINSQEEVTRAINRDDLRRVWGGELPSSPAPVGATTQPYHREQSAPASDALTSEDLDRTRALSLQEFGGLQSPTQAQPLNTLQAPPQQNLYAPQVNSHQLSQTLPQSIEALDSLELDADLDRTRALKTSELFKAHPNLAQSTPQAVSAQAIASHSSQTPYESVSSGALDSISDPLASVQPNMHGGYAPSITKPTAAFSPQFDEVGDHFMIEDTQRVDTQYLQSESSRAVSESLDYPTPNPAPYSSPHPSPHPVQESAPEPYPVSSSSAPLDHPSPYATVEMSEAAHLAITRNEEGFEQGEDLTQAHLDSAALAEVLNLNRYQEDQDATPVPSSAELAQERAHRSRMIMIGGGGVGLLVVVFALIMSVLGSTNSLSEQVSEDAINLPHTTRKHFKPYQGKNTGVGSGSPSTLWLTLSNTGFSLGVPNQMSETTPLEQGEITPATLSIIQQTLKDALIQHQVTEVMLAFDQNLSHDLVSRVMRRLQTVARQQSLPPLKVSLILREGQDDTEAMLVQVPLQLISAQGIKQRDQASVTWTGNALKISAPRARERSKSQVIRFKKIELKTSKLFKDPIGSRDRVTRLLKNARSVQRIVLAPQERTSISEVARAIDLFEAYPFVLVSR